MSVQPFSDEDLAHRPSINSPFVEHVPPTLERAANRLSFPPSYVVVGAYRLITDKSILVPVWKKSQHGFVRGLGISAAWAALTFNIQRGLVRLFWMKSPKVLGLQSETIFGYRPPFDLATLATLVFVATQASTLIAYFLRRNLQVARTRAWDQTVKSRHKGIDFFQPYVEEWETPPVVNEDEWAALAIARGHILRLTVKKAVLMAVRYTVPFAGFLISAWFKAMDTSSYLHRPYFEAKKMSKHEIATFIAEHKWDYRGFGFAAALVESLPIIGLFFSVSNRIGAAMWAFDLEKRQHYVAEEKRKRLQ
ncbi:unnamed protein product [Peniophora sp. CBMAI 1063]|nr:unnamed protein product [Peniophora sp. CBMAI 1063]